MDSEQACAALEHFLCSYGLQVSKHFHSYALLVYLCTSCGLTKHFHYCALVYTLPVSKHLRCPSGAQSVFPSSPPSPIPQLNKPWPVSKQASFQTSQFLNWALPLLLLSMCKWILCRVNLLKENEHCRNERHYLKHQG